MKQTLISFTCDCSKSGSVLSECNAKTADDCRAAVGSDFCFLRVKFFSTVKFKDFCMYNRNVNHCRPKRRTLIFLMLYACGGNALRWRGHVVVFWLTHWHIRVCEIARLFFPLRLQNWHTSDGMIVLIYRVFFFLKKWCLYLSDSNLLYFNWM